MVNVEAVEKVPSLKLRDSDKNIDLSERAVFDDRVPRRDKRTPENRAILESGTFSTASLHGREDMEERLNERPLPRQYEFIVGGVLGLLGDALIVFAAWIFVLAVKAGLSALQSGFAASGYIVFFHWFCIR